jgi:hypothetical protein
MREYMKLQQMLVDLNRRIGYAPGLRILLVGSTYKGTALGKGLAEDGSVRKASDLDFVIVLGERWSPSRSIRLAPFIELLKEYECIRAKKYEMHYLIMSEDELVKFEQNIFVEDKINLGQNSQLL